MFDFKGANDNQRDAIMTVEGPLLITAGPGTGKTRTLVQRALYMIQECNVKPEQILIATFTEKAAKELVTRISNELEENKISVNINDMYIGTFHSICLRLIKEYLEFTSVKKNYRMLDDFDQKFTVYQNYQSFAHIENFSLIISDYKKWDQVKRICDYINSLTEELIDSNKLISDEDPAVSALGEIYELYERIMKDNSYLDFSHIQAVVYHLLNDNQETVLKMLRQKIKYLMIDEYQDTNYIQEQIVFLLAGETSNICVVGDDDQGLYRFRGATIRNILEFPTKFKKCKVISLSENYRSDSKIIDFYNKWMKTTSGRNFNFSWSDESGVYRFEKTIYPEGHKRSSLKSPTVIKIQSDNDENEWHKNILDFIQLLVNKKNINLNQIAFLFSSVTNDKVLRLARYLEENGINVYSPRSDMFFERYEVKLSIGCLLLCFPHFTNALEKRAFYFVDENLCDYYDDCIHEANRLLKSSKGLDLKDFIANCSKKHISLTKNTDYAFSGLFYRMFEFYPFSEIISTDINSGIVDLRPVRNISLLNMVMCKFEYLYNTEVFSKGKIEKRVEQFFNIYMRYLKIGGIAEYEDESEYAPNGCVSFLTIHQSKGMEFPVVVVGSLQTNPKKDGNEILREIERKYSSKAEYEPYECIKYFDFWRKYYTAFSRAQNLLVLTADVKSGRGAEPSKYFANCFNSLESYKSELFDVNEFVFDSVKKVNLKETYSFTSHISVYEECSLQYKFYKEFGFTPVRVGATIFGTLVHETIEDVHRAAIRNEEHLITPENVRKWLDANIASISQSEHAYLGPSQVDAAYEQVLKYTERNKGKWDQIKEAEVPINLVKSNYIIGDRLI